MELEIMGSTYVISTPGGIRGKPGEARGAIFPLRGESGESTGKHGELIVQCGETPGKARGSPGATTYAREAFPIHRIESFW